MFSGIVQQTSPIVRVDRKTGLTSIAVDLGDLVNGLRLGASVSVAGVCLTVTHVDGSLASFDMMGETLAKTTLGALVLGDRVNIERSLKAGDEIGGHAVSGHVAGTAKIARIETPPNNWIVTFACAAEWMPYILP